MSILGLDVSSSVIGWCLLNEDGSYKDLGYVDLRKGDDLYEKLQYVERFFNGLIIGNENFPKIYVEDPLKMFAGGMSMAQTISLLQRWNGMVCGYIYMRLGIRPEMINPRSARSIVGIKVPKGANTKESVLQQVRERGIIPESKWDLKKTGKPKDHCFDQADAWVVAYAGYLTNKAKG